MSNRTSLTRSLAALALVCAAGAAQAQAYISGSISGQLAPGVYGQVNIGNAPPQLLYAQPMWGGPVVPQVQPIYMWVPPGHSRNWRRYCGRYHACGQPVYFVQESWVRERYDHDHGYSHGKNKSSKKHGHD